MTRRGPSRPRGAPGPVPEVAGLRPYTVPSGGRRSFLRLDFNENTAGPSPRVMARLRNLGAEDVGCYPDETAARAAVARHFGLGDAQDLVLTSGVDEGIRLVCDCFVRSGESVVLLEPGYAMYRFYATLAGANIGEAAIGPDLSFPVAAVGRAVASGARLAILGNPHNPTGAPVPDGLVAELAERHPRTLFLIDEAYVEYGGASALECLAGRPNLIVARTFSKAYGLAGLRAGALLGDRATLSWVARMRSPYAVNAAALAVLPEALDDADYLRRHVAEVRTARALLDERLRRRDLAVFPSAANFLLVRFGERAPAVREALRERGILVRDRSDAGVLRGTLRIGVGTLPETARFVKALDAILAPGRRRRPDERRGRRRGPAGQGGRRGRRHGEEGRRPTGGR